jgi:hypothetical protein
MRAKNFERGSGVMKPYNIETQLVNDMPLQCPGSGVMKPYNIETKLVNDMPLQLAQISVLERSRLILFHLSCINTPLTSDLPKANYKMSVKNNS